MSVYLGHDQVPVETRALRVSVNGQNPVPMFEKDLIILVLKFKKQLNDRRKLEMDGDDAQVEVTVPRPLGRLVFPHFNVE